MSLNHSDGLVPSASSLGAMNAVTWGDRRGSSATSDAGSTSEREYNSVTGSNSNANAKLSSSSSSSSTSSPSSPSTNDNTNNPNINNSSAPTVDDEIEKIRKEPMMVPKLRTKNWRARTGKVTASAEQQVELHGDWEGKGKKTADAYGSTGGGDDGDDDDDGGYDIVEDNSWEAWRRLAGHRTVMYLNNAKHECLKRKCQYFLGFSSVFVVVVVAAVCFTLVAKAPAVFFRNAEDVAGQKDLVLGPGPTTSFINYTAIIKNTQGIKDVQYHSPRFSHEVLMYTSSCVRLSAEYYDVNAIPIINKDNRGSYVSNSHDWEWAYVGVPNNAPPMPSECSYTTYSPCLSYICRTSPSAATITTIDSEKEKVMGLGRTWDRPRLGFGEAYVSNEFSLRAGVKKGDIAYVSTYQTSNMLQGLFVKRLEQLTQMNGTYVDTYFPRNVLGLISQLLWARTNILIPIKVADVVSDFKGKLGSVSAQVFMENDSAYEYMASFLPPLFNNRNLTLIASLLNAQLTNVTHPILPASVTEILHPRLSTIATEEGRLPARNTTVPPSPTPTPSSSTSLLDPLSFTSYSALELASEVIVNLPPERVSPYLQSDHDDIQRDVIGYATRALYFAGFGDSTVSVPISTELRPLRFFALFLGLILSVILTILVILSLMLIYSLLMISVETRTFELGVHRMTGMTRSGIVIMLLVQACSYSIPAWALGLVIAQIASTIVVDNISNSIEVPLSSLLTGDAITTATVLGLLIPLLAAVLPIRSALSKNLQDALDTRHSKTAGVEFSIERSEDSSLNAAALVLGTGLAVFGFLIYYLLPLSLLSQNFALFFNIFFGILIGLLIGLIILSFNFEHLLERGVVALFFFWEMRSIPQLVLKNLVAHRVRNRKTTLMYALSLGFIIFITVAYTTEIASAKATTMKQEGSNIVVRGRGSHLTYQDVQVLENIIKRNKNAVANWAWQTTELNEYNSYTDVRTSTIGQIFEHAIHVYGVSPSYADVIFGEYYVPGKNDKTTGLSFTEQLYTVRGSQSVVMDVGLANQINLKSLSYQSAFLLNMQRVASGTNRGSLISQLFKPIATIAASAAIPFTEFAQNKPYHLAVSIPSFIELSNGTYSSVYDLRYEKLLIKTTSNDDAVSQLWTEIRGVTFPRIYRIFDDRDVTASLASTETIMSAIFGAATYIAMFLCMFSLIASMYSNIFENAKEIAVLRAIGLTIPQLTRVYIYEAFVLVMAASIIGIVIGFIMGFTMTLQRVLFTQLPIQFVFPWLYVVYVLGAAIVCSLISSWTPTRMLVTQKIATIFRTFM